VDEVEEEADPEVEQVVEAAGDGDFVEVGESVKENDDKNDNADADVETDRNEEDLFPEASTDLIDLSSSVAKWRSIREKTEGDPREEESGDSAEIETRNSKPSRTKATPTKATPSPAKKTDDDDDDDSGEKKDSSADADADPISFEDPTLWSVLDARELMDRMRQKSEDDAGTRKTTKKNESFVVKPLQVGRKGALFKQQQQQQQQQQQPLLDLPLCQDDQAYVDKLEQTNKDVFDLAGDIIVDVVKEVKKLHERHKKDLDKLVDEHKKALNDLKAEHAKAQRILQDKLDRISEKIDSGQIVTNATFRLVVNTTTTLNEFVKKVYGIPLFKLWYSWKSHPASKRSSNDGQDNSNNDEAVPDTDFLFPQSVWDYADMLKWPLIIMHLIAWFLAGADNRTGSYICEKYNIKTPWFLKAFNRCTPELRVFSQAS